MINLEEELKKKRRMIREGKRKIDDDDTEYLSVKFHRAHTIDDDGAYTIKDYGPSYYRLMAWTDPEVQYGTQAVKVLNGHNSWMFAKQMVIPLDSPSGYLYIELHKGISWRDPGTSNGTVVKGRGKIRLPSPTSRREISRKVSLVVLNCDRCVVEKGTLEISMKRLKRPTYVS